MLDSVPLEIVSRIADNLSVKDRSCLSATCTYLRQCLKNWPISASFASTTPHSVVAFVRAQAEFFNRLKSRQAFLNASLFQILPSMSNLRHLSLSGTWVKQDIVGCFPEDLESVSIRKLCPMDIVTSNVFRTSIFDRFRNLKHVGIWISEEFSYCEIDHSREFKTIWLDAPTIVHVVGVPPAATVSFRLKADEVTDNLGRLKVSPITRIITTEFAIPRFLFEPSSVSRIKTLTYSCPVRTWIPNLGEMVNLRTLNANLDIAIVAQDDFLYLSKLSYLRIMNRFGFGVQARVLSKGLDPRKVKVDVFLGRAKIDPSLLLM